MRQSIEKKQPFTLVELMVVAIIVAILAAVAIPLMSANVTRAIATEAESALGTARSNLRAMYAETRDYTVRPDGVDIGDNIVDDVDGVPGFQADDLDGTYFSDECYRIQFTVDGYTLSAVGALSTADKAERVEDVTITLDQDGNFVRDGL